MLRYLDDIFGHLWEFRFFYRDVNSLLRDVPGLKERYRDLAERVRIRSRAIFDSMVAAGWMDATPDQLDLLDDQRLDRADAVVHAPAGRRPPAHHPVRPTSAKASATSSRCSARCCAARSAGRSSAWSQRRRLSDARYRAGCVVRAAPDNALRFTTSTDMPSFRARIINALLRLTVKPMWRPGLAIDDIRRHTAKTDARLAQRGGRLRRPSRSRSPACRATWYGAPELAARNGTLLYLHGGAWCVHLPALYGTFAAKLSAATGLRVLLVDYRLAPEHPFPAAVDDCLAVYRVAGRRPRDPAARHRG